MWKPVVGNVLNLANKTPDEVLDRINQLPDWTEIDCDNASAVKNPKTGLIHKVVYEEDTHILVFLPADYFAESIARDTRGKIMNVPVWEIRRIPGAEE